MFLQDNFERALASFWPELAHEQINKITLFRNLVLEEQKVQNLTKNLEIHDFIENHLADVRELVRLGWVGPSFLDLGSGVGVPGIPLAIVSAVPGVLVDSQKKRAI